MYPYRLSGKRLFIPGFGILPYVRGLRMAKRKGVYSFLVVHGGETWAYGCYSGNYAETVMSALRKLEELAGALYTGMILRTNERSTKKNPTGYAGIYKLENSTWAYRVTCPYETNEPVSSLTKAIMVREAARAEYERRNTHTLDQLLKQVEAVTAA